MPDTVTDRIHRATRERLEQVRAGLDSAAGLVRTVTVEVSLNERGPDRCRVLFDFGDGPLQSKTVTDRM